MLNLKRLEFLESHVDAETILEEVWAWLSTDQVNEIVEDIIKAFDLDSEDISDPTDEILDRMADGYSNDETFWSELGKLTKGE